jgi:hypothetical protein
MNRKQLLVFLVLLVIYALCAFLTYALFGDQLATAVGVPMPDLGVSNAVLGLANAGIILVLYGILGLVGYWFARKLDLPGIFSEDGNWRRWALIPLGLGALCGLVLIGGDLIFAPTNDFGSPINHRSKSNLQSCPPFQPSILPPFDHCSSSPNISSTSSMVCSSLNSHPSVRAASKVASLRVKSSLRMTRPSSA